MTPEQFIALWKDNRLSERAGAQQHFNDLCDLLSVDKPRDPDCYCFERGAKKSSSGDGWADVWKRGCFGWENKKPGRDLNAALKQLTDYALHLDNPPLLVVCDRERIVIHTAFTGYPDEPREIRIDDLTDPGVQQLLRWVFTDPEKLRPEKSFAAITSEAAGHFAGLAALHTAAADMDWRAIDPTIFGTLFERGLDPRAHAPLGAHYTVTDTIGKLIEPLITRPLLAEWQKIKALLNSGLPKSLRSKAHQDAREPILRPLESIEQRDALLESDGSEAAWPDADIIIGNPPFLGDKMMRGELGDGYVDTLRRCYEGRVPGGADLVTYWFEKARAQLAAGRATVAGLVATNSIRQKRNRVVLERILESGRIFEAWSDEEWINEGAAVRVSLVCFEGGPGVPLPNPPPLGEGGLLSPPGEGENSYPQRGEVRRGEVKRGLFRLNGHPVAAIYADLTGGAVDAVAMDLTQAVPLAANRDRSFFGLCLAGPFKVNTATALQWLKETGNPNGRPNSDVVRPIYNGSDITRRWAGNWVVDFAGMDQAEAADYLAPYAYVEAMVKPVRVGNREAIWVEKWWRHGRRRPELRAALVGLTRYIATPETAKHRFFVTFPVTVAPEHSLIVIPRQPPAGAEPGRCGH